MCWLKSLALLLPLLLHPSPARCQSASSSSGSSTSSREPTTRTVEVAKGGHTFVPDVIQAEVGDFVEFRFHPKNHSVVRAAYKYPCVPYEMLRIDEAGFSSGFRPVSAILDDPPVWEVRINDTDPIFYYCSAEGSCINYAMVGVINPNASTVLDTQRELAEKSTFMLQPGENWPDESIPPGAAGPGPISSGASPGGPIPSSAAGGDPNTEGSDDAVVASSPALGAGGIAGVAIGGAVVVLLAAALVYFCGRDRALSNLVRSKRNPVLSSEFENNGVQYVHALPKHPSGMTMASSLSESGGYFHHSPALPGYNGPAERIHSPPRAYYPPSDALSPATTTMRSPSLRSTAVPAYSKSSHLPSQAQGESGGEGPHEMDGGDGRLQPWNSARKTGVERYG